MRDLLDKAKAGRCCNRGAQQRPMSPPTTPPAIAPLLDPPLCAGGKLAGDGPPPPLSGESGGAADGPGAFEPVSGAGVGVKGVPGALWGTTDTMTVCAGRPSSLST